MAGQKNSRSGKDKEMASFLKKMGITRKTGRCPLNPRHTFVLGGNGLTTHLLTCKGTMWDRNETVTVMNRRFSRV